MIEVEQSALGAFRQNRLPCLKGFGNDPNRVPDIRLQFTGIGQIFSRDLGGIQRFGLVDFSQQLVALPDMIVDLICESIFIQH